MKKSTDDLANSPCEIANSIANPDVEISTNCMNKPCPAGQMPEYGEILDEREINALVEFLLGYSKDWLSKRHS